MNKEEILNKYIDLIDKGYCSYCNELNCIDNFPHSKITHAIRELQQENKQLKEIIKENTILVKDEYGDYQECNVNPLEMKQKYEKQVENWNKLKDHLENKIDEYSINLEYLSAERMTQIKNKMQELQGSDSNE